MGVELVMTIREELLSMGMQENEMDAWCSDLYVMQNEISVKWLETYKFKMNVRTFRSAIADYETWYDIPFGYMPEWLENRAKK